MLPNLEAHATIPAVDLERARKFYSDKLGFKAEMAPGGIVFRSKNSWFLVYQTQFAGTAQHTLLGWETKNIEQDMKDLRARGIAFEEYDLPDLKTVNGIASIGPNKAAWFKDSEGNILGLIQMS